MFSIQLSRTGPWSSLNRKLVEAGACVAPLIKSQRQSVRELASGFSKRSGSQLTQEDARWYRRAPFLRGMMANSSLAAAVNADGRPTGNTLKTASRNVDVGLLSLLLDSRLTQSKGCLASSYIGGTVTSFLSDCCEGRTCAKLAAFGLASFIVERM